MPYSVPYTPPAPVRRSPRTLLNGAAPPPTTRAASDDIAQDDAARAALAEAVLAEKVRAEAAAIRAREAAIDAALEMTFPASDPPAWTS